MKLFIPYIAIGSSYTRGIMFMLLCFSNNFEIIIDHEWTTRENQKAQSSGVYTSYLKTKTRHDISQDISENYLILQNCSICSWVVLQFDVLFLGSPVALQHDLGPKFAAADVSSHMWVSTGRTGIESSSGQGPCFCSSTLRSRYISNYPTRNTANHNLKNLPRDALVKTE